MKLPPYKKRKVADLVPYARNARTHSDAQINQVAASIKEFGFTNPIIVDEKNEIIAGHGRVLAAKRLGMTEVPTIELAHLTPAQKRAYILADNKLADNKLAENAGWDKELLRLELGSLSEEGFDLKLVGFDEKELAGIFDDGPGSSDAEDDTPALSTKPVTQEGDVWILGKHRVICGSATEEKDVKAVMEGGLAHLVNTDPPYGVSYESASGKFDVLKGDEKRQDDLYKTLLAPAFKLAAKYTQPDAAFYIWHASSTRGDFVDAMHAAGLTERQYIIWVKPSFVMGRADYQWSHEPCFYAARDGHTPLFYGGRSQSTVWRATLRTTEGMSTTLGNGLLLLDGEGGKLYVQPREPKNKKIRELRVAAGKALEIHNTDAATNTWEVAHDEGSRHHPTAKPVELGRRAIENSTERGQVVLDLFGGSGSTLMAAEQTDHLARIVELDPRYCDAIIQRWQNYTGQKAINEKTGEEFHA